MRPGWDIFCRVVDHFGDAGVCWRLARQLAQEFALDVRLWIDAPQTLQRLAPDALPGTRVHGVAVERWDDAAPPADAAQVVIGAFQCLPPAPYRESMRTRRSCWINLEHLSAEAWVEAHHGLPSPKPDGLVEHFFFPGFTESTGGLLRERQLLVERDRFQSDPQAPRRWLAAQRVQPAPDETLVSLFCYPDAPVAPLLDALAARPQRSRVLVPQGVADAALAAWANSPLAPGDAR
ncbi:MAG TPA: elongation factor P maturation arginine rhamnosyltransferase EarP, partial [Burkholderiaceae bacterium]|nr:elongation factor P maturation arginine rhamnosyltransferase EarP [Burkholderiaceae bacterium]